MRLFFAVWLRYRAQGVEKIPPTGGGVLLVNHQSFLDPLLVGLPLQRPVSYLARDTLFRVPVIGWILRHTYVIPINREAATTGPIKEAVRRLKHGFLVGVFPEGTRTHDGTVGEFKPGFVALIRRAKLPVYPVGIAGAQAALPRSSWFLKPRPVVVVYGDPFTEAELAELCIRGNEAQFVAVARERVLQCQQIAAECLERRRRR